MKLVEYINSAVKWRNKITISLQTYISDMHPFLAHTIGFFMSSVIKIHSCLAP